MLGGFDLPKGAVVGLIADEGAGVLEMLRNVSPDVQCHAYTLDCKDAAGRIQVEQALEELRRKGGTAVIASHDEHLLKRLSDEIWWIDNHEVTARGDADEILRKYHHHVNQNLKQNDLSPKLRRGDGRAELLSIETAPAWTSGEPASIQVKVRFHSDVADPVVGIMIRTRIGMEVYGTNTELEKLQIGPCKSGDEKTIQFDFTCNLCPQYYTITAASHDPDGVWHDWAEDAIAVVVQDTRYTAGVANLRATVTCR